VTTILVSAGDASGDIHAAAFVHALRERLPGARFLGLGGVELEKEGVELVVHQREVAVAGLLEVAGGLRKILGAWRALGRALRETHPDLVVLVDTPDFNLPMARRARRAGIPVLYYIGPQVWAWRRGRVRKIARRVDRLAVIFPFEAELYRPTGLRVDFVGHPLVERMALAMERHERAADRRTLALDPDAPTMALLPGSRRNEIENVLPLFLATARVVHARDPRVAFVLPVAPTLRREWLDEKVRAAGLPSLLRLEVVEGRIYEALSACDVALAMPGTVNLEVALMGRPQVAAVRVNWLTWQIARRLVRVPWVTLPNLIARAPVVPEFLQDEARPEALAEALLGLLSGPARATQLAALALVRERLGPGGAAERTAEIARAMIRGAASPAA
jgi:lipid-A-disaccharide synthase